MDESCVQAEAPRRSLPKVTFEDIKEILNRVKSAKQKRGKIKKPPVLNPGQRTYCDSNGQWRTGSGIPPSVLPLETTLQNVNEREASVRQSAAILAGANTSRGMSAVLSQMERPTDGPKIRELSETESVLEKDRSWKSTETFQFSEGGTSVKARHIRVDKIGRGQVGLKSWNTQPRAARCPRPQLEESRKEISEVAHPALSPLYPIPDSEVEFCCDSEKATPGDEGEEAQTAVSLVQTLAGFPAKNRQARSHTLENMLRSPPTETERLAAEIRQMAHDDTNPHGLRLFFDSIIEKYVHRPARDRGHPRFNRARQSARERLTRSPPRRRFPIEQERSKATKDAMYYGGLLRDIAKPIPHCVSLSELYRGQGTARRVATAVRHREMQIIQDQRRCAPSPAPVLPPRRLSKVSTDGSGIAPAPVKKVLKLPKIAPPPKSCIPQNIFSSKSGFPFYNLPWQK